MSPKSIEKIEERMRDVAEGSIRHRILQSARAFKTSWIELGQGLYAVWKDKLYREWGYATFEAYTAREIGIRKQTAVKLLKSYYFLEKEEPVYLEKDYREKTVAAKMPSYESVNVLRLAKDSRVIDDRDYARLKKEVLEMGKNEREAKRDLTGLIRQRRELDPEEAREKRRIGTVKRLIGALRHLRAELEASRLVSAGIIRQTAGLIAKLEAEIK